MSNNLENLAVAATKQIFQLGWQVFSIVRNLVAISETGENYQSQKAELEEQFTDILHQEYRLLCTSLEFLQLKQQLSELNSGFAERKSNLRAVEDDPKSGHWISSTQKFLNQYLEIVRLFVPISDAKSHQAELEILENILRSTAVLVSSGELVPKNETQINNFMAPIIKAAFPKTLTHPTVPGVLKTYEPEFGIPKLQVLIEYKFADNEKDLTACIDGIFTDMGAYSGDVQWKVFFAVFYLTHAFSTESQVRAHLERSGVASAWQFIVVNGTGGRKKKAEVPAIPITVAASAMPNPA